MSSPPRLLLIDPDVDSRDKLARRLEAMGFRVEVSADGIAGIGMALENPPNAVIADLWTPGVSGIQICRFLRSEPATMDVPVLLRGEARDRRNRYWAERAGAKALLEKGRVGELLRALTREIETAAQGDGFFMHLAPTTDIRDRIARQLDAALFDSVIASELRALANCGSTSRLFDRLTQFVSQVTSYRWLALRIPSIGFYGLHHHPGLGDSVRLEACAAFGLKEAPANVFTLEDDDANADPPSEPTVMRPIGFAQEVLAEIALSPVGDDGGLIDVLARELGPPLRVTSLVEETRRLAATDTLTGVMNRRAFIGWTDIEVPRCDRHGLELCVALVDIDHFKQVNDSFGHAAGDRVLAAVAAAVRESLRESDVLARWGGEEFVIALPHTDLAGGARAAERIRLAIQAVVVRDDLGRPIPVTASLGVAARRANESLEQALSRADAAMYRSKREGRNRVTMDGDDSVSPPSAPAAPAPATAPATPAVAA